MTFLPILLVSPEFPLGFSRYLGVCYKTRHQVLAASSFLANITCDNSDSIVDHVKGIISSLGHHLEEEMASKEHLQELSLKLKNSDKLYNARDRRKLSEAGVLDGRTLMEL